MNLSEIHINPSNPRIIKDERFKKLVKSISEFPKMMSLRPIIVDADGMILGGNMRFKALKELKYKDIPDEWVKRASELTDEEKQRFIIEDNVPFGEWDFDILANEWDADQLAEWGLEIPDFAVNEEVTEDDYEVPDEIKTDIVLGDLFEIGPHRLLCGDSTSAADVSRPQKPRPSSPKLSVAVLPLRDAAMAARWRSTAAGCLRRDTACSRATRRRSPMSCGKPSVPADRRAATRRPKRFCRVSVCNWR